MTQNEVISIIIQGFESPMGHQTVTLDFQDPAFFISSATIKFDISLNQYRMVPQSTLSH